MADDRTRIRISLNPNNESDCEIMEHLEKCENPGNELKELAYAEIKRRKEEKQQENEIVKYQVIRRENKKGKRHGRWFGKRKQSEPEYVKYTAEEVQADNFRSLEEYLIRKNLDPSVMSVITGALEKGVDYGTILSMVENGLNAQQMRCVIELFRAKAQMKSKEE